MHKDYEKYTIPMLLNFFKMSERKLLQLLFLDRFILTIITFSTQKAA